MISSACAIEMSFDGAAIGSLHAVIGPQHLLAIRQIEGSNGFLPPWADANQIAGGD
jgi:hypothetical protein